MIRAGVAAAVLAVTALAPVTSPPAGAASDGSVRVGTLELRPCHVVPGALCGSVKRAWEPGRPNAGRVEVGFAFRPATDTSRPALGTLVPHEGGPGYSTTDSGSSYLRMYGPRCWSVATCSSWTSEGRAGPSRSTARCCRT